MNEYLIMNNEFALKTKGALTLGGEKQHASIAPLASNTAANFDHHKLDIAVHITQEERLDPWLISSFEFDEILKQKYLKLI